MLRSFMWNAMIYLIKWHTDNEMDQFTVCKFKNNFGNTIYLKILLAVPEYELDSFYGCDLDENKRIKNERRK